MRGDHHVTAYLIKMVDILLERINKLEGKE
jgi:hypothetical protein